MAPHDHPASGSNTQSYSTELDGHAVVTRTLHVSGQLGDCYLDFVAGRAAWLSLSGWIEGTSPTSATCVVRGPEALVGALEMACWLGPIDSLIDVVRLEAKSQAVPAGFSVVRR
jgi:hypothetical protein